jgi:hypothetical protein
MKSKFSSASYFLLLLGFPVAIGLVLYLVVLLKGLIPTPPLKGLPLALLLSFTLVWLFWGEFRTKMIKVEIDGDVISVRKFGGLGKKRDFLFSEFDGFKTSLQPYGARGILEYLYILNGNRKTIKISEAYHSNYHDLKVAIGLKIPNLGNEDFSFSDEFKEIFL